MRNCFKKGSAKPIPNIRRPNTILHPVFDANTLLPMLYAGPERPNNRVASHRYYFSRPIRLLPIYVGVRGQGAWIQEAPGGRRRQKHCQGSFSSIRQPNTIRHWAIAPSDLL